MPRDEQIRHAEDLLAAALLDQPDNRRHSLGIRLNRIAYADDEMWADYEHALIYCTGPTPGEEAVERGIDRIMLPGDLTSRDFWAGAAERVIATIQRRRARLARLSPLSPSHGRA